MTTSRRCVDCRTRHKTHADVAMPHSASCWRWLIDRDGSIQ